MYSSGSRQTANFLLYNPCVFLNVVIYFISSKREGFEQMLYLLFLTYLEIQEGPFPESMSQKNCSFHLP